jgi:hypothetical protein
MRANEFLFEKWSDKYKRSIDCSNPKGFSQKAHCAGRKKKTNEAPQGFASMNLDANKVQQSIDYFYTDHAPKNIGGRKEEGSFKGLKIVSFTKAPDTLMFLVDNNDQAVFYVAYSQFEKGVAIGNVRSNGAVKATEVYAMLVDKFGTLYSDLKQTPQGAKIWSNLAKFYPNLAIKDTGDRLIATKKTNEDYVSKIVNKVKTDFDKRSTLFGKGKTVKANTKPIPQKQNKTNEDADFYDQWDHDYPVEYSKYLEKTFGAPDEITNEQTVWHNKDGFKRIVCRDEYILHCCPAPHYDFVYSYIDLEIDEDLSDDLANCSGSILIDHLKNEVGARCGSLTANAVTLNFCLDVSAGRTEPTPEEYERRILEMKDMFENGKKWTVDWWPDESGDADPDNPFYAESVNEDLRDWFGKGKKGGAGGGGWDRYNTKGERIGKCGDAKPNEGKPKCLSKSRAASLRAKGGKAAIAAAVKKKRREDPNKNRRGKAKNVSNTVKKK